MEKELTEWAAKIGEAKNQEEIKFCVDNFDLATLLKGETKLDNFINIMGDKWQEISFKNMPYVLDALYQNPNKAKFVLFCVWLEATYDKIPFITPLHRHSISNDEQFSILWPVLGKVAGNEMNGIGNCMWLILLKYVKLFMQKQNQETIDMANFFLDILLQHTNVVLNFIKSNGVDKISSEMYFSLELWLDAAGWFMSDNLAKNITEIITILPAKRETTKVKRFGAFALLKFNKIVADEVLKSISEDILEATWFLEQLEEIDKVDQFPKIFAQQEYIARSNMINWLVHPNELGQIPNSVTLLGAVARNGNDFYIYKFKTELDKLKDKGWMLGVSGGYPQGKFTAQNTGATFSKFEAVQENINKQAVELIEFIDSYWKEKGEQFRKSNEDKNGK